MKRNIIYALLCVAALMGSSCKKDNYTAPDAGISGALTDAGGKALQLEQGKGSARIKLEELSWSNNPTAQDLNFLQDGRYSNNKLFAGRYRVAPFDGPFYPLDSAQMKTVELTSGNTTVADFKVVPYLNVDFAGEPVVTADKKISVSFKFTRNAAPAGKTQPAPLDYQLFISTTQYVGNNNFDNTRVGGVVAATAAMENQVLTISSSQPMKYATTYFIRIGVRVNDAFKKYNYTTVKTVQIPN